MSVAPREAYALRQGGRLVALARREGPNLQPFRVFAVEGAKASPPQAALPETEEAAAA